MSSEEVNMEMRIEKTEIICKYHIVVILVATEGPSPMRGVRLPLLWFIRHRNQFLAYDSSKMVSNENTQENNIQVHQISYSGDLVYFSLTFFKITTKWGRNFHKIWMCNHYVN